MTATGQAAALNVLPLEASVSSVIRRMSGKQLAEVRFEVPMKHSVNSRETFFPSIFFACLV